MNTFLKGDATEEMPLSLAEGFDYSGKVVYLEYQGVKRSFSHVAAGDVLTFSFTAEETAPMSLGTYPVRVWIEDADGSSQAIHNATLKLRVTNNPADIRMGSAIYIPPTDIFNPANYYDKTAADEKFVAQIVGKGLSTEDYTSAEKTKLGGVATGAQVNVIETVKVNGTALTPGTNKAVNIVPVAPNDATAAGQLADALSVKTALAGKAGLSNNNTFFGANAFGGNVSFTGTTEIHSASESHTGPINLAKVPTLKSENADASACFSISVGGVTYYLVPHITVMDYYSGEYLVNDSLDITSAYVRDLLLKGLSGNLPIYDCYIDIYLQCIDSNGDPVYNIPISYYDDGLSEYVSGYIDPNLHIGSDNYDTPGYWTDSCISFYFDPDYYAIGEFYFTFPIFDDYYNQIGNLMVSYSVVHADYSLLSADDSKGYYVDFLFAYAQYSEYSPYPYDPITFEDEPYWYGFDTTITDYVPTRNDKLATENALNDVIASINSLSSQFSNYPSYSYLSSNYVAKSLTASTTQAGIVQLSASTSGTSATKAATEGAVKSAYDRASTAITNAATAQAAAESAASSVPYALVTLDISGAGATLTGRAINYFDGSLLSAAKTFAFTLPAAVSGKVRDCDIYINTAATLTASIAAPSGETATFVVADGADYTSFAAGQYMVAVTEIAASKFLVSCKELEAVV